MPTRASVPEAERRAPVAEPSIKSRVKNTFLHFSDSGEASSNGTPRHATSDTQVGQTSHFRSPYKQGCLAGLDLPHNQHSPQSQADSSSLNDGNTSEEHFPSAPSTDWEYSTYHRSPVQQIQPIQMPLSNINLQGLYAVAAQGVPMWPYPCAQVPVHDRIINVVHPPQPAVEFLRNSSPDLDSSSSEDLAVAVTSSNDGTRPARGLSHSDPERSRSDQSETARSEAGPPPKSMAKFWEADGWTKPDKPDDPQSSMDESTAYATTVSDLQKKARRGGKRMNRPCHLRAKQQQAEDQEPFSDAEELDSEQRGTFYPSLSKQELEAHLKTHGGPVKRSKSRSGSRSADIGASLTLAALATEAQMPRSPVPALYMRQTKADVVGAQSVTKVAETEHVQQCSTMLESAVLGNKALEEAVAGTPSDLVGKRVLVQGLMRMPEFNGDWGQVLEYEDDSQRYKVSLIRASGLAVVAKLRRQNLFIATEEKDAKALPLASVMDVGAVASPCQEGSPSTDLSPPVSLISQKETATEARQAISSTRRRASLRRAARSRGVGDVPLANQKVPATSSTCSIEVSSKQLRREPSCPVTSTRQSSGFPDVVCAKQLRARQPSCPASSTRPIRSPEASTCQPSKTELLTARQRQPAGSESSARIQSRRQPSRSASRAPRDMVSPAQAPAAKAVAKVSQEQKPVISVVSRSIYDSDTGTDTQTVTSKAVASSPAPCRHINFALAAGVSPESETIVATPPTDKVVSKTAVATPPTDKATSKTAVPSLPTNKAGSKSGVAAPATKKLVASKSVAASPATKKAACKSVVESATVPALDDAAAVLSKADDPIDVTAEDDVAVVKKWQRHRVAREAPSDSISVPKVTPDDSSDGLVAPVLVTLHSDSAGTSIPDSGSLSASSSQAGRADSPPIAAKECTSEATKWRPSLRLRR